MNTMNDDRPIESDDASIERLLREVGARSEPSAELASEVRAIVHAEWREVVAERTRRKRAFGYGIAASLIVAVLGVALLARTFLKPIASPQSVASIAKIQADAHTGFAQVSATQGESWRDIGPGEKLSVGMLLRTDAATSVAIAFDSGLSLRVDRSSLLQFVAADRAALERGRVYVDAPLERRAPLVVQTRFGAIEHVGTQYQAQLLADRVEVSVREGRVAIARDGGQIQAVLGERVAFGERGEIERQSLSPWDASWQWAVQAAPSFDIENQSLARFLDWVARETGKSIRYSSSEVRQQAETLILHGSIAALGPEQALRAVLATTPFVSSTQSTSIDIRL